MMLLRGGYSSIKLTYVWIHVTSNATRLCNSSSLKKNPLHIFLVIKSSHPNSWQSMIKSHYHSFACSRIVYNGITKYVSFEIT